MSDLDDRIRIVQCLCPLRHCILAFAFDPRGDDALDDAGAVAKLKAVIEHLLGEGTINPWCALCESRDWHYETAATKYRTMDEAAPNLGREQAKQLETQAWLLAEKAKGTPK